MSGTRIQSASAVFFGTAVSVTFTAANLTAGTKIIAAVASSWSDVPTSVRDGASNNLTSLGSIPTTTGSVWLYAMDTPAGDVGTKPTITATWASSNGQSIVIQEVSGLLTGNTSAMIDGTAATKSGKTATTGAPAYTSTAAGEYLVCIFGDGNFTATTVAAVAGMTKDANSASSQSYAAISYGTSTGGAETTGWTSAPTGGWAILTVAFKLAGGTGHTATASLTVTPTFAATRVRGHPRTASLTVTPSAVATPRRGRRRTASLTVTPSTTATPHLGAPKTATASLTITPSFTATRVRGHPRTAGLTVTPSTAATPRRGRSRTASLTVTPSTTAARSHGQHRAASLTVTPSAAATGSKTGGGVKTATASLTVTPSFTATRVRGRSRTASLTVTPATIATPHAGHVIRAALALLPAFRATPHKSGSHPAARPGGPPDEDKTLAKRRMVWRMMGL